MNSGVMKSCRMKKGRVFQATANRKGLVWLALLLLFAAYSCSKDNNTTPAPAYSLPKTLTEKTQSGSGNSDITYNLTYDDSGRIVSIISTSLPELKVLYQYSQGSFTMDDYTAGVLQLHEIFWLNSISYADSAYMVVFTTDTATEKYAYNSAKQMTQKKVYRYFSGSPVLTSAITYTWGNDGNIGMETDNSSYTTSYTYYPSMPNPNLNRDYFSKSKNLVKTAIVNTGGFVTTTTHYYNFDSSNRLLQDSAYTAGSGATLVRSYTY